MRRRLPGLRRPFSTGQTAAPSDKMAPMTATPAMKSGPLPDLARLRDLTSPHLPHPAAPIGPALARITPADRA